MEGIDVKRFGLILAIQAEVEGMKSDNALREQNQEAPAWSREDFQSKAEELRNMSYCHDEQM